jgi:hydroxymethylbilane synthase
LFVAALRERLLNGAVDIVVHSMKDLPSAPLPGLSVVAVPPRADRRDVLVTATKQTLSELPIGSRVGTSSPRRAAALARYRPDLKVVPVRGNVDTRIAAVAAGSIDGVLLARAGLIRLGRQSEATEVLDPEILIPAPGQGALAVECRSSDEAIIEAVGTLDDPVARASVAAERAVLSGVSATCATAVGASAWVTSAETGVSVRLMADLSDHKDVAYARVELQRDLPDTFLSEDGNAGMLADACTEMGAEAALRLLSGGR